MVKMKIGSVIFVAAITVTLLMAVSMNLVSAEPPAKARVNPSGEQNVKLNQEQQKVNLESEQYKVELNRTEPRALPLERAYNELGYDDGWDLSGHTWGCAGSGYAVRFTPPSYPVDLQTARINFWPNWPNIYHETFAIYVYADDSRDRQPGTCLGGPVYHTATNWYWNDVDISGLQITIESGDFYILYLQLSGHPNCEALSFDRGQPYYGRSWNYSGGSWSLSQQAYNYMIRCVVKTQSNDIASFCDGLWYVDTDGDHVADDVFGFGFADSTPLVGDINRDGTDDIAAIWNCLWYVDTNKDRIADQWFSYGLYGDTFIVGDINREGIDDVAVVRGTLWYVDTNGDHVADLWFSYGLYGDTFVVGDVNRNGIDDVAAIRGTLWYVDTNGDHVADIWFNYGSVWDTFLVGDIR